MSRPWTRAFYDGLEDRLDTISAGLVERLEDVIRGRVAPQIDAISIGSARYVRAAILFFDIRGFSLRTGSADPASLKLTLAMLDCVIPMVMHVVHEYEGYVEKNTGDGVMALFGIGKTESEQAETALDATAAISCVMHSLVNPRLTSLGILPVDFRIGIDIGEVLVARIGVATGSADQQRNFLTAVGPAANIACRLQQAAGTNEQWVGDRVYRSAPTRYEGWFQPVTPLDWPWVYGNTNMRYWAWRFDFRQVPPVSPAELFRLLRP